MRDSNSYADFTDHLHECEVARTRLLQVADLTVNSQLIAMSSWTAVTYPWLVHMFCKFHEAQPTVQNEMIVEALLEITSSNDRAFAKIYLSWCGKDAVPPAVRKSQ